MSPKGYQIIIYGKKIARQKFIRAFIPCIWKYDYNNTGQTYF